MKRKPKQQHTSTKVVIAAVTAMLLFWLSEIYLLTRGGEGFPDSFIRSWFYFWSVELVALAGIKITKVKRNSPYDGDSSSLDGAFPDEDTDEEISG